MPAPFFDHRVVADLLHRWLTVRLQNPPAAWLQDRLAAAAAGDQKALYLAFGLTARKLGKSDLALTEEELADADLARTGWNPRGWTIDQAARILLLLNAASEDAASAVARLDQLFAAGEMHELIALYQGLPLYPFPAAHVLRCAEGIRTNIKSVFCAIAHRNPYPSEQLNEDQWNQLVLKCLFVGVPLAPVVGLDARANAKLAGMLVEFAHERWAAHRPVSPELWRCVGPFADDAALAALKQVLRSENETERCAAALAVAACPESRALELWNLAPGLREKIERRETTWEAIADASSV